MKIFTGDYLLVVAVADKLSSVLHLMHAFFAVWLALARSNSQARPDYSDKIGLSSYYLNTGIVQGFLDIACGIQSQDFCFSDSANEPVRRKMAYRTRRYVTSGGKTRVPDGLPGEHTPFVRRLLEALRSFGGPDGVLTLAEILASVETVSPERRSGEFWSDMPGNHRDSLRVSLSRIWPADA